MSSQPDPNPEPQSPSWLRTLDVRARAAVKRIKSKAARYLDQRRWRHQAGTVQVMNDTKTFRPQPGLLTPADPLNLVIDVEASKTPTLNVLLPGINMSGLSGGPNTIYNLTYRMAAEGVPVRYLSTSSDLEGDLEPIWQHIQNLTGIHRKLDNVSFACAHNRGVEVAIGENDVFLATAWWTAQMVKYALPLVRSERFLYIIQDFEAVLHEHSTAHALCLETYDLDYVPIVNHAFLLDYLKQAGIGRFADPDFADQCTVIDPSIDRSRFYPALEKRSGPRRLLFYARPDSAKRNLYELGVAALQYAIAAGGFEGEWEFLGMGDKIQPVDLGGGHTLRHTPWQSFDAYAAQMRGADVLLSLMLSPHPSYPPLEMAACGGLVVTNSFLNKTQEAFAAISSNIAAPPATIEGVGAALADASQHVHDKELRLRGAEIPSPTSWDDSLKPVLLRAVEAFAACQPRRSGV